MKELVFTDQAKIDLRRLDRATRLRVAASIQRLVFTNAGNIKKLQGIDPPEYRLRIGDWRVRFSLPGGNTVRINRIRNRKEAYRRSAQDGALMRHLHLGAALETQRNPAPFRVPFLPHRITAPGSEKVPKPHPPDF